MRLDDPGDRERVPGRLEHDLIIGGKASGEQLKRRRRRLDPPGSAHLTALCDRDLAEVTVHVERNEAHRYLLTRWTAETRQAKRQLRIRARGTPGRSQGRPTTNDGLAAHSVSAGLPNLVSPRSPYPGTAADDNPAAGHKNSMRRSSCPYNTDRVHHGRLTRGRIPADIVYGANKMKATR